MSFSPINRPKHQDLERLTQNSSVAFNAFTLLLFCGAIELDTMGRGLVVDGWLRLRGWARIGVLVSRLRGMVDDVIRLKVESPSLDVKENEIIKTVARLIEYNGLDA